MWLRLLLLLAAFVCDRITQSEAAVCTNATCTYELVIKYAWTMQYTDNKGVVHDVTLNGTDLQYVDGSEIHTVSPNDVITADGYPRRLLTFNGQYPGPPIEVIEGSQVSAIFCSIFCVTANSRTNSNIIVVCGVSSRWPMDIYIMNYDGGKGCMETQVGPRTKLNKVEVSCSTYRRPEVR